jgi:hypothetical protein
MSSNESQHNKYWSELKKLSDQENVIEFLKLYCKYLEASNIISPSRGILYKMIQKTINALDK